jgi:hypothetical protein
VLGWQQSLSILHQEALPSGWPTLFGMCKSLCDVPTLTRVPSDAWLMVWDCVKSLLLSEYPQIHMLNPEPQGGSVKGWELWGWIGHEGDPVMWSLPVFVTWGLSKRASSMNRKGPLQDTESAYILILGSSLQNCVKYLSSAYVVFCHSSINQEEMPLRGGEVWEHKPRDVGAALDLGVDRGWMSSNMC